MFIKPKPMVTRWLIDYRNAPDYLLHADNLEFATSLVLEMGVIWDAKVEYIQG